MEYALTLADVDKPKLALVGADKDKPKKKATGDSWRGGQTRHRQGPTKPTPRARTRPPMTPTRKRSFPAKEKPDAVDPIKTESLSILEDLAEQQRRVKLAAGSAAHPKG